MVHRCCDESVLVYADQWDVQATIARLNESLIARGYATWFDMTNMKGSTVDAMSDAIERADVMLYGVSLRYKESANVCAALHCVLNSLNAPVLQLTYNYNCAPIRQAEGGLSTIVLAAADDADAAELSDPDAYKVVLHK